MPPLWARPCQPDLLPGVQSPSCPSHMPGSPACPRPESLPENVPVSAFYFPLFPSLPISAFCFSAPGPFSFLRLFCVSPDRQMHDLVDTGTVTLHLSLMNLISLSPSLPYFLPPTALPRELQRLPPYFTFQLSAFRKPPSPPQMAAKAKYLT